MHKILFLNLTNNFHYEQSVVVGTFWTKHKVLHGLNYSITLIMEII